MDHEAGEEKADQQRRLDIELRLIRRGRSRESKEEQEAADEQRRIVRVHDGPRHEAEVDDGDPRRDRQQRLIGSARPRRHFDIWNRLARARGREFAAEAQVIGQRRDSDGEQRRASRNARA